mgnify:CR=1 FL=1
MKSLKTNFARIAVKNPYWSSHTCFAEAVANKKFAPKIIAKWFNILVEKDEYAKADKKEVLSYLVKLSNPIEAGVKSGVIGP